MSTLPQIEGVEPVEGEPTRYWVSSESGKEPYLVDVREYDGNGACDCTDFKTRKAPKLEAGERDWLDSTLRCKHLRRAWLVAGPRAVMMIDPNP